MTASRLEAHALRACACVMHAEAYRLEDKAERLDVLGIVHDPTEFAALIRTHERMAAYWRARASGKTCEEAEDESDKLGEGSSVPSVAGPVIEPGAAS